MKKVLIQYNGWGESWPFGVLAENRKQLLFEYTVQAQTKKLELSPFHLKLGTNSYGNFPDYQFRLPGLIADCLPDGWGLLLMDKLFRKQGLSFPAISPLDRLSFLGDRSMGAFTFEPLLEEPSNIQNFSLLKIAQEVRKIVAGQATDALPQLAILGGSPQGARPKVLVNYRSDTQVISSDPNSYQDEKSGVPWIFKFQAKTEHKEQPALEKLYNDLAEKVGLRVSESTYFDLGKSLAAFGTRRFDRVNQMRVPVHTLAGLLHADFRLPSSVSYNSFLRVTRVMTRDENEVYQAFKQCVFNVIFNNRDDHPKNFSFRLENDQRWKLSPAYDLTFCRGPGGEHQMDICGEGRSPSYADLMNLAEDAGLKIPKCREIIEKTSEVALQFKQEAKNRPIRTATIAEVNRAIQSNLKILASKAHP